VFLDQCLKFFIKTTYYLGEEHSVFGNWFLLSFTENEGAAFGIKLNVTYGKLFLTIFRILAVGAGIYYLYKIIKQNQSIGLITCVSLIIAGAIGNIIDCVFYGVYFSEINDYQGGWFHGYVVDMLYFPLFDGHFPSWFPIWGGEHFEFFSAVFNIADLSISTGIITLLVFQGKFFPKKTEEVTALEVPSETSENEASESTNEA
jgi:signal peptidase II